MRSAAESSPIRNGRRRGERWIVRVPHEGHTSGSCARSAAMSASASGARYSLIPRLPTATPLRTEIYTTLILTHFPRGPLRQFLTPPRGACTLPPPLPPFHASRARWFANLVITRSPTRHRQRAAQSRGGRAHQGNAWCSRNSGFRVRGRGGVGALRGAPRLDRSRRGRSGAGRGTGRTAQEETGRGQEGSREKGEEGQIGRASCRERV